MDARSPTVLVVDDDPDILEALGEILEAEGYQVRRARNGKEALEQVAGERPRLVLLDLMMPVMDGREFSRQLASRPGGAEVPIIILSADRHITQEAESLGAVGHVAKPFELDELLAMVRDALGKP